MNDRAWWCKGPLTTAAGAVGFRFNLAASTACEEKESGG